MSFGHRHAALFTEYRSLMDEERVLWTVISGHLGAVHDASIDAPQAVDLRRWNEVRDRRAALDDVIQALAQPRTTAWAERVGQLG